MLTQCQQGKTSATTLKNPVLLLISLGKSHEAIFKQFGVHHYIVRTNIQQWKTFKTSNNLLRTGDPSKITLRLHFTDCSEKLEKNDSTIRQDGLFDGLPGEKLLFSETKHCLSGQTLHTNCQTQ